MRGIDRAVRGATPQRIKRQLLVPRVGRAGSRRVGAALVAVSAVPDSPTLEASKGKREAKARQGAMFRRAATKCERTFLRKTGEEVKDMSANWLYKCQVHCRCVPWLLVSREEGSSTSRGGKNRRR